MTYHHQMPQSMEFDVFEYLRTGNVQCKQDNLSNKIYVRIDRLFTDKMLKALLKSSLPDGTYYSVNHFVFYDVDVCIKCLIEMYRILQNVDTYNSWATSYIKLFQARNKKDV